MLGNLFRHHLHFISTPGGFFLKKKTLIYGVISEKAGKTSVNISF
jgi:hypothetical protein